MWLQLSLKYPGCFRIKSLLKTIPNFSQVFVHGDELDNYIKEFDADILPADFDGKASVADCQAIATKLFGSEDTALWENSPPFSNSRVIVSFTHRCFFCDQIRCVWSILKLGWHFYYYPGSSYEKKEVSIVRSRGCFANMWLYNWKRKQMLRWLMFILLHSHSLSLYDQRNNEWRCRMSQDLSLVWRFLP